MKGENEVRRILSLFVFVAVFSLLCTSRASAQTTYTQKVTVQGRSGEMNFFGVPLYDSSGTLLGNYSLDCNTNAINNFTCGFTLVLGSVTYYGKVTQVTTYFPFPPGYRGSNGGPGPFAYDWSASASGVTLSGSSQGTAYWGSGGCHTCGYAPFIEAGTTVTVN